MPIFCRSLPLLVTLLIVTPLHAADDKPAFSLKTPIEKLAANPDARAILDRELPGFTTHPQYEQFKAMSLDALQAMFPAAVSPERAKAVDFALRAIPAEKPAPQEDAK